MNNTQNQDIYVTWPNLFSVPYPLQLDVADITTMIKGTPTNLKHEVFTLKYQQYRIISYVYNKRKQLRVLSEQKADVSTLKKKTTNSLCFWQKNILMCTCIIIICVKLGYHAYVHTLCCISLFSYFASSEVAGKDYIYFDQISGPTFNKFLNSII